MNTALLVMSLLGPAPHIVPPPNNISSTGSVSLGAGVCVGTDSVLRDNNGTVGCQKESDVAPQGLLLRPQPAFAGGTQTAADLILAGGQDESKIAIDDYTLCEDDTVTVTVVDSNGLSTATILTESELGGADWNAVTSAAVTCANLATALDAVAGVGASCTSPDVRITIDPSTAYVTLAESDATCTTVTVGTMGKINLFGNIENAVTFEAATTISAGAGALTLTNSAGSFVLPDNDSTALLIGSTGQLGLLTLDTGNGTETVVVNGTASTTAFDVAVGRANFAENVTMAGINTLSGGAGTLTLTNTAASILIRDNDSTALDIGATGATSLMRFDTGDATETVSINGTTAVTAFDVAVGTSNFAEAVTLAGVNTLSAGAGALTFTNSAASILLNDNDTSALDIGSAGDTQIMSINTSNGASSVGFGTAALTTSQVRIGGVAAGANSQGLGLVTSVTPGANLDGYGAIIAPTIIEDGGATTHAQLTGLRVAPVITAGAASVTTANGIDVPSFTAQTGTTTANGISVAAPTGATTNVALYVSAANDIGWTIKNAANQACNTTCNTASGCVFGMNTGALGNFVACTDATADTCLCAGP